LAVIDLVTGDPPITTADGQVAAVLNGEIYNYLDLRRSLQRDGHRFATTGDTEVLAHLAEAMDGVDLANTLEGMFAIAIWDAIRGRLLLIRDRLGKKPLYWAETDTGFVFGSEIKALTAHPSVTNQLDVDAVPAFLHLGYVPTPRTFFDGIRSVPPGCVMTFEPGRPPVTERYWNPPGPPDWRDRAPLSLVEAARQTRDGLRTAVERRLLADVPLGAFLSGGVDSAAVVGLMAQAMATPVKTFTIGFDDDEGFDERVAAALVATRWETDHTEFVVAPFSPEIIDDLVWHHDQPFGDSSALPTYFLSKLTREHVTVALSGDGGDELFAGYERFLAGTAAARLGRLAPLLGSMLAVLPDRLPRSASIRRFGTGLRSGMPGAYREWVAYTSSADVGRLVQHDTAWWSEDYRKVWDRTEGAPTLDRLLDLNLRTYLLDDLLPKVDRMSMAHGLEVRSPFLDHHLLELAATFKPNLKVRRTRLKRVLREAVADLVPASNLAAPKRGFGVPLARWFREDLDEFVVARLGSRASRIRSHVRGVAVDELLARHRSGSNDHSHTIWQLLTLETFLRQNGW
jgi:asparagine synthase (glutamine-hydrolysing)